MGDIMLNILNDHTVRDTVSVESAILQLSITASPWL